MCPSFSTPERQVPGLDRSSGLILVAVFTLTVFYYRLRTDTIGVTGGDGGLSAMTGPVLSFMQHNLAALVVLGLLPLAAARWLCGLSLRDAGLGLGRWRPTLIWTAIGVPVALLLGGLSAADPVMRSVYPLEVGLKPAMPGFLAHMAGQLAFYLGWELLFRGVLLGGLTRRFGFAGANTIQTALSVIAHFGRPLPETLAAIPAGLAFGGVARRTGSIWPVVIIHLAAGAAQDWFIVELFPIRPEIVIILSQ
ncbi:MAG: CPBP family intramembrane metalloprotease [Krumholzibacteria bacterium]|nr:CPBP family intramembrane metalloprotease [Candidatus Krumholzibacteria bacterium]